MLLIHSGFIRSRAFNKLYYIKMSPALLIGGKIDFVTAFFKPLADFVRSIIVIIKNTGDCTAYNWCRHGCSAFGGISIFLLLHAVILEPVTTSSGLRMPSRVGPRPELNVLSSIEPTVMTRRLVPGAVMLWDFGPLLPAAATTIMPSFHIFSTFFISSEVLEGLWVVPKEIFTIFIL